MVACKVYAIAEIVIIGRREPRQATEYTLT